MFSNFPGRHYLQIGDVLDCVWGHANCIKINSILFDDVLVQLHLDECIDR